MNTTSDYIKYIALSIALLWISPQQAQEIASTIDDPNIILPEAMASESDSVLFDWFVGARIRLDDECTGGTSSMELLPDSVYRERLNRLPHLIEMTYNPIVKRYIELYTGRRRNLISQMLGLSEYYFPLFEEELERWGVPHELKYLPIVESALRPEAVSRAGAAGLWQFMVTTGKSYNLQVNSLVDERRDPIKSSAAAAKYLKDLHALYSDWTLALAAYNCGPGNVNRAIKRSGGKKNYWEIYPYLPQETRGYIPAFIAANYVMSYYREHRICPALSSLPMSCDTVVVNERIKVDVIARQLDLEPRMIQALNPQFRSGVIPANTSPVALRLPSHKIYDFMSAMDSIVAHSQPHDPGIDLTASDTPTGYHKVRRGETLSSIAQKYRTTSKKLRAYNHLKSNNIKPGKRLIVSVGRPKNIAAAKKPTPTKAVMPIPSDTTAVTADTPPVKGYTSQHRHISYRVNKGDTLMGIANKFPGITFQRIKEYNQLPNNNIRVGQILRIPRA